MIGRTAWIGAVCALTERSAWEAEELLHSLERKQLLQRVRHSSIDGETEFNFTHALTKDVAYSQIRRADRAQKHEAAAEWIERLAGERDDKAELLADHYHQALELRRGSARTSRGIAPRARASVRRGRPPGPGRVRPRGCGAPLPRRARAHPERPTSRQRAGLMLGEARALSNFGRQIDRMLQAAVEAQLHRRGVGGRCHGGAICSSGWYRRNTTDDGEDRAAHLARAAEYATRRPSKDAMPCPGESSVRLDPLGSRQRGRCTQTSRLLADGSGWLGGRPRAPLSSGESLVSHSATPEALDDQRDSAEDSWPRTATFEQPSAYGNLADALRGFGNDGRSKRRVQTADRFGLTASRRVST